MLNQQLLPVGMGEVPHPSLPRGCTAPTQHLSLPMGTLGVLSCATPPFWGAQLCHTPLLGCTVLHSPSVSSWLSPAQQWILCSTAGRNVVTELDPRHLDQMWAGNRADGKGSDGHLQDVPRVIQDCDLRGANTGVPSPHPCPPVPLDHCLRESKAQGV